MTVLIGYASAHSSTIGVASQIADRLTKSGFSALVRPVSEVDSVEPYEAVVLGSAIHNQAWLPEAAGFLNTFSHELAKLPVWLFSVSSVGDTTSFFGPKLTELIRRSRHESDAVAGAREAIPFRDHHHFAGAFERGGWSLLGDLFLKVCGGSPGDHRDWRDINEWAGRIARDLQNADHHKERRRLHLSVRGRP